MIFIFLIEKFKIYYQIIYGAHLNYVVVVVLLTFAFLFLLIFLSWSWFFSCRNQGFFSRFEESSTVDTEFGCSRRFEKWKSKDGSGKKRRGTIVVASDFGKAMVHPNKERFRFQIQVRIFLIFLLFTSI